MGGLPGCQPTHHAASATPCVTTGPSVRRCLPPLNPAVVSPDPTSLRRPLAGFGLLAQPGSASPPMGTSPNWIYRPSTRPAPFDLCPTAQHEKNSPSDVGVSATPQEKRASPPPSLLAPWVVPRGQLRWRRGGRGGRGGGGGRERESPLVSPLRRRGGRYRYYRGSVSSQVTDLQSTPKQFGHTHKRHCLPIDSYYLPYSYVHV
jgi:hypothetical protein